MPMHQSELTPPWAYLLEQRIRVIFGSCFILFIAVALFMASSYCGQGNCPTSRACSFEVFDAATAAVEAHRPCAYVVAFAARDAAYLASGVNYSVPAGRRDGRASLESEPLTHIPLPNLRDRFADKGLSLDDIVALSGTNSIGRSHCTSFAPRLYNFSAARPQDPGFAAFLKSKCPPPTTDVNSGDPTTVSLDAATPARVDNRYYKNLLRHRGGVSVNRR